MSLGWLTVLGSWAEPLAVPTFQKLAQTIEKKKICGVAATTEPVAIVPVRLTRISNSHVSLPVDAQISVRICQQGRQGNERILESLTRVSGSGTRTLVFVWPGVFLGLTLHFVLCRSGSLRPHRKKHVAEICSATPVAPNVDTTLPQHWKSCFNVAATLHATRAAAAAATIPTAHNFSINSPIFNNYHDR